MEKCTLYIIYYIHSVHITHAYNMYYTYISVGYDVCMYARVCERMRRGDLCGKIEI